MIRLLSVILLALGLAAPVFADDEADVQRHVLTPPMLEKFNAAQKEFDKLALKDDKSLEDKSIDEIAKVYESNRQVKPILAKYGFTGRSYLLTALAATHASLYLSMESGLSKKDQAAQMASMSPQMRANIELLRKNPSLFKK